MPYQDRTRFVNSARIEIDAADKVAPNGAPFDQMFIASTERLASDGGVILTEGWRTKEFMQNPRFIANHNVMGWDVPITEIAGGSVVWTDKRKDLPEDLAPGGLGLVTAVRFATTPFGQELNTLYTAGDLDAVSVRWDPWTEERRHPTEEEKERYGDDLDWVATRADLRELSAVILGADPGAVALRRCRSQGIELPHLESFVRKMEEFERMPVVLVTSTAQELNFHRSPTMADKETLDVEETVEDTATDEVVDSTGTREEDLESTEEETAETQEGDEAVRQEVVETLTELRASIQEWSELGIGLGESLTRLTALFAGEEVEDVERADPLATKISLDLGDLESLVTRIEVAVSLVSEKLAGELDSTEEEDGADDEDMIEFDTIEDLVAQLTQ